MNFSLLSFLVVSALCLQYGADAHWHESQTKRIYPANIDKLNFFQAYEKCRSLNMRLATIPSVEENEQIIEALKKSDLGKSTYWISANDLAKEGNFVWRSNGQPVEFANWAEGNPNNQGQKENCVEIMGDPESKYLWNDVDCSKKNYYICEKLI